MKEALICFLWVVSLFLAYAYGGIHVAHICAEKCVDKCAASVEQAFKRLERKK